MESTSGTTSPDIFRKWGGIAAVAGALERKVWVHTMNSNLYPNLYVVMVAPPGVGKTEVTWRVHQYWEALDDHHLASSSVTKASLIDELAAAERRIVRPQDNPAVISFNSLLLCINELGVLLPAYENDFMNTLTDLFDCKTYSERRRTSKIEIKIKHAQLNLLAACTPSYLMNVLPEGAWDQGFLSRTILVYNGEQKIQDLFASRPDMSELEDDLREDIKAIGNLYGKMTFTEEAAQLISHWHMNGQEPKPDHFKLQHYNTRRTAHLLKLSMVASASASKELVIEVDHIERAMGWLFEAESYMPDIFKSSGGVGRVIEEAWHYLFITYAKEDEPVQEHRLIQFLQEKVPVHNIVTTIDMMTKAKLIEKRLTKYGNAYVPKGKQP